VPYATFEHCVHMALVCSVDSAEYAVRPACAAAEMKHISGHRSLYAGFDAEGWRSPCSCSIRISVTALSATAAHTRALFDPLRAERGVLPWPLATLRAAPAPNRRPVHTVG